MYSKHISLWFKTYIYIIVCLIYVFCFCLHTVVSHIVLCFIFLRLMCCQFLWSVNFWLPLRYSLTFTLWYTDCRPGSVDVVFVVDTSSSVANGVNKSIDFIERFVRIVSIGPDMFQVAVLTYNVEPTVLFDLDDHTKEEGIIDALQTIRGHDAVTFTAPALRKAAEVMYNV